LTLGEDLDQILDLESKKYDGSFLPGTRALFYHATVTITEKCQNNLLQKWIKIIRRRQICVSGKDDKK